MCGFSFQSRIRYWAVVSITSLFSTCGFRGKGRSNISTELNWHWHECEWGKCVRVCVYVCLVWVCVYVCLVSVCFVCVSNVAPKYSIQVHRATAMPCNKQNYAYSIMSATLHRNRWQVSALLRPSRVSSHCSGIGPEKLILEKLLPAAFSHLNLPYHPMFQCIFAIAPCLRCPKCVTRIWLTTDNHLVSSIFTRTFIKLLSMVSRIWAWHGENDDETRRR